MEDTIFNSFLSGFNEFLSIVSWTYVIVFIICSWVFNETSESDKTSALDWFRRIPKVYRTFIIGLLLMGMFSYFERADRDIVYSLTISLFFSMAIWRFGVDKLFEFIKKKI
jgi:hypothetical protein